MNSVKNLMVIVMLMAVSWGAWQVINTPDPSFSQEVPEIEELNIEIGQRVDEPSLNGTPHSLSATPGASQPESMPSLPPQFRDDPDLGADIDSQYELPSVDVSAAPVESAPPVAPGTPENTGGSMMALNSQFQPQPQTGLQPVDPKPVSSAAAETLDEISSAMNGAQPPSGNFAPAPPADTTASTTAPAPNSGDFIAAPPVTPTTTMPADVAVNEPPMAEPPVAEPPVADAVAESADQAMAAVTPQPIDWTGVRDMALAGNERAALTALSRHYDDQLPPDERMRLLQWLDQLAGKVIYSTEHLVEQPWVVAAGDSLESLSAQWQVPAQLIYNINRASIADPAMLVPGTELKVIRGPFHAQLNTDRQELTLFVDGLYAGRFPVELGAAIEHGSYAVTEKSDAGQEFRDQAGQTIAAGAAGNPYGQYWLGLDSGELCLHESAASGNGNAAGCIRLSSRDAADVYGILGEGSQVTIMR